MIHSFDPGKMGHDLSSKTCKFSAFLSHSTDFVTTSIRVGFLLIMVSFVLFGYYFFSTQYCWFSECRKPIPEFKISVSSPALCTGPDDSDSEPTNITHIVFGLGGSGQTWANRSKYSGLWWEPNQTRGFIWLDEPPKTTSLWSDNSPPHRISSDWTRFRYSSSQSAVRLARIVVDSFRVGLPDVRWFVMGDDDTVFFKENLLAVLRKYDHRRMCYIGGNSESVEQDVMHSYDMAFGGGGFAISYPLAARLSEAMDGCLERYYYYYGSDQRVWACAKELGVSLTLERGFHQIDIRGNLLGLLTAHPLTPLVSLHHLDYVKPLFPNMSQYQSLVHLLQAYHADPAQIIQQRFCYHHRYKWSVSVAWGYVVHIYPKLLPAVELEKPLQTFKTWRSSKDGPFVFNTRPVNSDPCEKPLIYYLESVSEDRDGRTVTSYKMEVDKQKCKDNKYARTTVKRIRVTASKMHYREWKHPRRRCCEIGGVKNGNLEVGIRRCEAQESLTY